MPDEPGHLEIDGDHVDFSYRNTDDWPAFTPTRSIASHAFTLGDPTCGAYVSLGAVTNVPGEDLDWEHTIDPMHFHGSDQFRLLVGGEWVLAREPMGAGQFGFQEAGRVYQEHPGPGEKSWIFLVYGDRRGVPATLTLEEDRARMLGQADIAGTGLAEGDDYPHPAGPKGVPAIATSAGKAQKGYLRGSFTDVTSWRDLGGAARVLAGVWGDAAAGPVVYLLSCGPDRVLVPECAYATEVTLVVSGGSCRVGDDEYLAGEMRVQASGSPIPPVVSGPDGVEAAFMVADRRARPSLATAGVDAVGWKATTEALLTELTRELAPTP